MTSMFTLFRMLVRQAYQRAVTRQVIAEPSRKEHA